MNSKKGSFFRSSVTFYLAFLVTLILRLLIVRMILSRLGPELLGTWGIIKASVLWPAFIQQGFSFAYFLQVSREEERTNQIGEPLWFAIAYGSVIALLLFIFAPALTTFFRIPPSDQAMVVFALRLSGFTFLFSSVSVTFVSLAQGLGRFDVTNFIQILFSFLNAAGSVWLLSRGYGILALIELDLGVAVVMIAGGIAACKIAAPGKKFGLSFRLARARALMRETAGQFLYGALGRVLWDLDTVLIPRFFGLTTMASYWIARRIPWAWSDFVWGGTWPSVPEVSQKGEAQDAGALRIHWLQVSIALPAACFLWNFADSILFVWIGKQDVIATALMRIMILGLGIEFIPATIVSVLFGRAKVFAVDRVLLFAAIIKILLSIPAIQLANVQLLILSTAIGAICFAAGMLWVGSREVKSLRKLLLPIVPSGIAMTATLVLFYFFPKPDSLPLLAIRTLLFLTTCYLLTFLMLRLFFIERYVEATRFLKKILKRRQV